MNLTSFFSLSPNSDIGIMVTNFDMMVKNKKKVAIPAKVSAHSTQVAEYFTYSILVSCMGNNGVSKVGTMIRYLFTQSAITMKKEAMAIQVGFLVFGNATIKIGSMIPAKFAKRNHQPYSAGLNIFSITSLFHFSEPYQSVRYSEKVKYP